MAVYDINGTRIDTGSSGNSFQLNNAALATLLIAHRGGSSFPENTMAGLEGSVETNGYKAVEFDWRFTSDGVPVALHDATINRTARNDDGTQISSSINISSITYQEALSYDFGIYKGSQYAGQRIPTLEQVLQYCKKKGAMVELDLSGRVSTAAQYKTICDTVVKCGMLHSVSFCVALSEMPNYLNNLDTFLACITARTTTALIDAMSAYPQITLACSVPLENLMAELVNYAHEKGYFVKVWTANSAANIGICLADNVDWVITDSFLPSSL